MKEGEEMNLRQKVKRLKEIYELSRTSLDVNDNYVRGRIDGIASIIGLFEDRKVEYLGTKGGRYA